MLNELWYAARRLRARASSTAVVIAIFAVGTGAALTVFRLADAILLRSLPYRDADRLVHVATHLPIAPSQELPFSDVGYRAIENRTHSFSAAAAYRLVGVNLTHGDAPERVLSARVTANFFDLLGLPPVRGRSFQRNEETLNGPPVVVLSDALWRRSFGARDDVIGVTIRIDGAPATIIGVADSRLAFPAADVGFFTLMNLDPIGTSPFQLGLDVVARLRPGVSLASATNDASIVIRQVARENPGPHRDPGSDVSGFRAIVRLFRDDMTSGVKPTLELLTAAVVFVLCLTCVNVATLELVRSSRRRAELAVRSALGADRRRLIFGAVAEGTLQAVAGGMIGLGLSAAAVDTLESLVPAAFGRGSESPHISVWIGVAAVLTIAACAGASGFFPIVVAFRSDVQSALRDRDAASRKLNGLRRGLVVTQIAFACALVSGAAAMIITVRDAQRVVLGFRPEGLLLFQLNLPRESYPAGSDVSTTFRGIVDRLREVPGVTEVALASNVPLDAVAATTLLGVEGRPFRADGTDPNVDYRIVSPEYFSALGLRRVGGRLFGAGDSYLDGTPVIINETLAKALWPDGGNPVGHRVRTGPFAPWMSIVGVVSDSRNRALAAPTRPELFLPFGAPRSPMGIQREMTFVVRAGGSLNRVQKAAQQAVLRANPDLPVYGSRRYEDVIAASEIREITTMRTLAAFAGVALVLAITGSYAMLMFSVVQRHRELAVRQAVGATRVDIVTMIAREMGTLVVIGIGAGLAASFASSRLLSSLLMAVSPLEPRVVATTLLVVALAGVAASILPARRAGSVDLMVVLRGE
jgi:putative ABC transport system permease protein